MREALQPGATIGILGGGQLGRMLSVAAARLGFRTHIFEPGDTPPASDTASRLTTAAYENKQALIEFAQAVDVVTYEFENIPTEALDAIETIRTIRPGREALRISQDRLTEKTFLQSLGLNVAPFHDVADQSSFEAALVQIGAPSILKTRRFGYDGKGQARIETTGGAQEAFDALSGQPAILEGFVEFSHEVSVIAARSVAGEVACFDPGQNEHVGGILRTTKVPARLSTSQRTDAVLMAANILNALDYVGVLGVELFVTSRGLVVNEIAPRVHNSGHWTQNGCAVDQFEQHIRAIAGWPLGDGKRHADVTMENLIGDDLNKVSGILREPNAALHLYGKSETKPGRKMGHVNRIMS